MRPDRIGRMIVSSLDHSLRRPSRRRDISANSDASAPQRRLPAGRAPHDSLHHDRRATRPSPQHPVTFVRQTPRLRQSPAFHQAHAQPGEATVGLARRRAEVLPAAGQAVGGAAPGAPAVGVGQRRPAIGADWEVRQLVTGVRPSDGGLLSYACVDSGHGTTSIRHITTMMPRFGRRHTSKRHNPRCI
jgi:hypothetical protein